MAVFGCKGRCPAIWGGPWYGASHFRGGGTGVCGAEAAGAGCFGLAAESAGAVIAGAVVGDTERAGWVAGESV